MSAISSIGGSGQGLYQFLQSVSVNGAAATSSASATAAQPNGTDATGAAGAQPHHHHHHHGGGGGGGDLFKKIEDAVTSALQSAQTQGNGAATDPNQTIENAIAQVFKQQQGPSTSGAAPSSADGNSPAAAAPSSDAQSSETSARNAFFNALKSFGVSPQQFHADFLAALQQSHDGQPNVGVALQSFPPGSVVDTTA
jgi:hypothetical protein